MKLLIYNWNSYLQQDLRFICNEKNINFTFFDWNFESKNVDERFEHWFLKNFTGSSFDALFSVNYWPLLSKVAQNLNMKYIAWCYDNPLNVIDIESTLGNPVNEVFFFDKIQASTYIDKGFSTVHYLPLCVNTKRLSHLKIDNNDINKYSCDVSFIGSLYESRYREIHSLLNDYSKGYLDSVMAVQKDIYGYYLIDTVINDTFIHNINDYIKASYPESKLHISKEALSFAMASELTRNDRLLLLSLLGKRFNTKLYSFQTNAVLNNITCCPPVNYVTEMPKVFACSKINLNPILRCIQSGIPLRALDIMGCGGFLLSSFQPELAELFENEREMVMYDSLADAVEKASFYLKHDDLRDEIAQNGKQKIMNEYSLSDRWDQIMNISFNQ